MTTRVVNGAQASYWEKIQDKKKAEQEMVKDNAEEEVIQTGSNAYTQKQWNGMLKNFDEIAEKSREEMRNRHEKQYEKQLEREERAREAVMEDYIEAVQEAKRNRARQLQEQYLKEIYEEKA